MQFSRGCHSGGQCCEPLLVLCRVLDLRQAFAWFPWHILSQLPALRVLSWTPPEIMDACKALFGAGFEHAQAVDLAQDFKARWGKHVNQVEAELLRSQLLHRATAAGGKLMLTEWHCRPRDCKVDLLLPCIAEHNQ